MNGSTFMHSTMSSRIQVLLTAGMLVLFLPIADAAKPVRSGKSIYDGACVACHATGVLQAPRLGNKSDWSKREKQGFKQLLEHALKGYKNMPAKGGNPSFGDEEIANAIRYMLSKSGFEQYADAKTPASNPKHPESVSSKNSVGGKKAKTGGKKKTRKIRTSSVNRFNRLLKPASERNPPPPKDGLHDPKNEGTYLLQPPREAFESLTKARSGNRVDWVKALENGEIAPRYERLDDKAKPVVMDLNIIREVKGSMPNVLYPHKQHTEWLDCSNCHPAIFIPQKGANQITMASILLGQKCGVCHGKVAFPISECRKCHSQKKTSKTGAVKK